MNIDRRRFLILSGGIAAIPTLRWTDVLAQDATPSASPVADPRTMFGPVKGNSPYKLAYMQVFPDNPFWQTMKEAVEARAAEDGVTVDTFALPTASGVADQVESNGGRRHPEVRRHHPRHGRCGRHRARHRGGEYALVFR